MKKPVALTGCLLAASRLLFYFSGFAMPQESPKAKTYTVEIVQMKFKPAALTVKKGDKVIFVNRDLVTHNVTEISGKSWRSPNLASGASWNIAVKSSADYFCTIHPMMKGHLLVKP